VDEHGALAGRDSRDDGEDVLHGATGADDRGQPVPPRDDFLQRGVLAAQRLLLRRLGHDLQQLRVLPRLADEIVGAQPHRLDGRLHVGVTGEHDRLDVDVGVARPSQDVEPRMIRQMHVDEGDVEGAAREPLHRLGAGHGLAHGHWRPREHHREHRAYVGIVVDDEHVNGVGHLESW